MNERFERPQRRFGNRENRDQGGYGGDNRHGGFHQQPPVKVDDELDVRIEAVGEKGDGVAKKDGFVLFIPGVKEGEEVKVKVTRVLRKVGFAEVIGRAEGPIVKEGTTNEVETEPVKEAEPDYSEENDSEDFGEDETEETEKEVEKTEETDEEVDEFAEEADEELAKEAEPETETTTETEETDEEPETETTTETEETEKEVEETEEADEEPETETEDEEVKK